MLQCIIWYHFRCPWIYSTLYLFVHRYPSRKKIDYNPKTRSCNFFSIGRLFKSKVCYDKYGCFDRHPNLLVKFPQEPSKLGTSFLLFTRKNSQTAKIIDDSDVNKLRDSFFEISRRTIFLIHGFTGKIQLLLIIKLLLLFGVVSSGGSRGGAPGAQAPLIFGPN